MKKILPLAKPPITTFPSYAAALGIMANYEESYDWFYSQYIQLCAIEITNAYEGNNTHSSYIPIFFVDTDTRRLTNTFSDYYFVMRENCPFLGIFELPNELADKIEESFISLVRHSIDLDMYIFAFFDVSKISQYKQVPSVFHEMFIYGYDDEKKEIYFADFPISDSLKYAYSTCKYSEMEQAYASMNTFQYPVIKSVALIKYMRGAQYTFDLLYVKDSVRDYLYPDRGRAEKSNDYTMSLFKALDWKTKTYFGIDVYDFFLHHIKSESSREHPNISLELFHALYDHKEMMIKRTSYFISKGYLNPEKSMFLIAYEKVRDNALAIRNMIIKYNIKRTNTIIDRVCNLLETTKEQETLLLKSIFDIT